MSPLVEIGERVVKAKVRVVYEFVDESIVLECFSIVAEVKADVPIDILAFGIPGCATWVRIPRAYGHIRAQFACIGDGSSRHGRRSRGLVIVFW